MFYKVLIIGYFMSGAGRGGRTPMPRRAADFESAASASSTIPAHILSHCITYIYNHFPYFDSFPAN